MNHRYDAIVVGGGPAGLSAALVLGRCCRRVLVCDAGHPRNARSAALHGFLTRDGTPPGELLRLAREELAGYDTVELRCAEVVDAERREGGFAVTLRDGERLESRTLLVATGVRDQVPRIEGLDALYGTSVHHCPICDGWEYRGEPVAAYGTGDGAAGLALSLTTWTDDVVLCTDGPAELSPGLAADLARREVRVRQERVLRLDGSGGRLERIVFAEGPPLPRRGLFFHGNQFQRSPLPARLGCDFNDKGTVATGPHEGTNVPGLYVAGDASKEAQLVVVAAAEGAMAACAINAALLKEDLAAERPRPARQQS